MKEDTDYEEIKKNYLTIVNKVQSFKSIRFSIKLIGSLAFIYFLYKGNWIAAFLFWFFLVPDLHEVTRLLFVKKKDLNTN